MSSTIDPGHDERIEGESTDPDMEDEAAGDAVADTPVRAGRHPQAEATPKKTGGRRRKVTQLLSAAVAEIGGVPREGQVQMAEAVDEAINARKHLLVQAGTGTGKSLGYLVPAVKKAVNSERPVIISTATLALQAQVVERDLPRLAGALTEELGRSPSWQLVKGRRNYVCVHKLAGGFPDEDALFDAPAELPVADQTDRGVSHPAPGTGQTGVTFSAAASRLGREVVRLREWAETTRTGDRDELVPGVSEKAWRQVSVSAHECLGASRCPMAGECHVELARERARDVDIVVTNHALVAIDSFEGRAMLPEHDVLVLDEAHEFADRVTSVTTDEMTPAMVESGARMARRVGVGDTTMLEVAGETLEAVLEDMPAGRLENGVPDGLLAAISQIRDSARAVSSSIQQLAKDEKGGDGEGALQVARAAVTEIFDVAERFIQAAAQAQAYDVIWVSRTRRPDGGERISLHVAPLSVAGLLQERLYSDRTVVLTSATLTIGGNFDSAAGAVGLGGEGAPEWTGLDVGSPFDYPKQGILYLAKHLPQPGRDGASPQAMDELEELIKASGGRTLGLFSSRRAAEAAAEALRERLDMPILCQGDDSMNTLVKEFAADPRTCLFGTLTLWQGVDVPGPSCQLVVVDRIPFPRPDDPLASARQRAVAKAGGNGFMSVAATHAALRLAQGVGRLIRSSDDKGVVAVLDPRLATARYGSFLRASLPPFWTTTDKDVVLKALRRIDEAAESD
ncbi:ATP-dependent DNA helicase [Kineosporia sp. NBRC 101731]|uniref:ATP-dependent DNA helicase n=1 Tax=Kineosporia sp. NBRC 101731 TaxID=3032199 RepID=UPI0024A5F7C2|nr:ATP-dependent DNA helicase [Kineosporia sp. NBRC 101731]GLY33370.1 ATP-dependent DNA helicase DinG [Kineosporia sp. NBRC 101731]